MKIEPDITDAIDIVFKMRRDGRMDKEEAGLILDAIFSGYMDTEFHQIIKFMYRARPYGNIHDDDFVR